MKNRNIPFGYKYEGGATVIHDIEAETVIAICRAYLNGDSLRNISERLTAGNVEYAPGIAVWNKARIMRIIDDERYLGKNGFPPIIDEETHSAMQRMKTEKNSQRETDRASGVYQLKTPVVCAECGSAMRREHDSRNRCKQKWVCENDVCKTQIKIEDDDLLCKITECMNTVIADPEQIRTPQRDPTEPSIEQRRLDNEIARTLEGFDFDKNALRQKMLQSVSLRYAEIGNETFEAERLKAIFTKVAPLTEFSPELVEQTVRQVRLKADGTVSLILENNQEIQKEMANHDDADSTTGAA